jgi:hypothetical protein
MTDVRKTAYLAEAQTALSTDLNGDLNDTWSALSGEFDNSTNGYMFMDIEVYLAAPASAWSGADSAYEIYIVPSVDGTNYPDYVESGTGAEQENNQYFVGSVTTQGAGTVACRQTIRGVEVPNGKFKIGGRNVTNQTLAATGNTVKWRPWAYKSA